MADPSSPAPNQPSKSEDLPAINSRSLKRLKTGLGASRLSFLFKQILEKGFQQGVEYNLSNFLEKKSGVIKLPYSEALNQVYKGTPDNGPHQRALLPGDVVGFLAQIYYQLPAEQQAELADRLSQTLPDGTSPLNLLNSLFGSLADAETIYRQEEQDVGELIKNPAFTEVLRSFDSQVNQQSQQDQQQETEEQGDKDTAKDTDTAAVSPDAQDTESKDEPAAAAEPTPPTGEDGEPTLINRDLQNTISSLTVLSIDSILTTYTEVDEVPGISYQNLPPELQAALYQRVRTKIESFVLGLSPEEAAQLFQDDSQLRYKLLQEAHQFLRINPQARALLQTAVEHHYQVNSPNPKAQEKIQENYQQKSAQPELVEQELEQAANQAARKLGKEAGIEDFADWLQHQHLDQRLGTTQELKSEFAQKMNSLLGEDVDFNEARLAILENSIASVVLADPLSTPRFVQFLSPEQLSFFLGAQIPPNIAQDKSRLRALRSLLGEYWTVYRAKHIASLKQNSPQTLAAEPTTLREARLGFGEQRIDNTLSTANSIRSNLADQDTDADDALNQLVDEGPSPRDKNTHRVYWEQLSDAKKRIYLRYVYGGNIVQQFDDGRLDINKIVTEFNHLKYLLALNDAFAETQELKALQEKGDAEKQAVWDSLSDREKQRYVNYVYGPNGLEKLQKQELSKQAVAQQLRYQDLAAAQNEAALLKGLLEAQAETQQALAEFNLQLAAAQLQQNLALIQQQQAAAYQLAVAETLYYTQFPTSSDHLNYPHSSGMSPEEHAAMRLKQSGQIGQGMMDAGLDVAAGVGVDLALRAALDSVSAGTWEVVEALENVPVVGDAIGMIKDALKEEVKKKIKNAIKAVTAATAAVGAALTGLISLASKSAIVASAGVGTGVGFAIGGPVGAAAGGLVGGIGGGFLTGKIPNPFVKIGQWSRKGFRKIGDWFRGDSGQETLRQTSQNVRSAAQDLGSQAQTAARGPGVAKPAPSALQSGAAQTSTTPAAAQAATQGALANLAANSFGSAVVVSSAAAGSALFISFMSMGAAFLANFPYTGVETLAPKSNQAESRYVKIVKSVEPDCDQSSEDTCETPSFNVGARYQIAIEPKEEYTIEVTGIQDEITVHHNKERYEDAGETVPSVAPETRTTADFNISEEDLTIEPGEVLVIEYEEEYTEDYNHASIRNRATIDYSFSGGGAAGQDSLVVYEVLRLGDYPKGMGCWPTTGRITQGPYDSYTHSVVDAYDITPDSRVDSNLADNPIYSSFEGEVCRGHLGSVYGEHLTLKTEIEGETYVFVYGHFVRGSTNNILGGSDCVDVHPGDILGQMGSTGKSDGVHLHFERRGGYDNSLTLTQIMPEGDLVDEFSIGELVVSCFDQ
mgnify:CR=1 FL=1